MIDYTDTNIDVSTGTVLVKPVIPDFHDIETLKNCLNKVFSPDIDFELGVFYDGCYFQHE